MIYWDEKRRDIREGTILALVNHHERQQARATARYAAPKAGDLVMIRDIQKDKVHDRKMDANWLGPRLLVELTPLGAGYVRQLYEE